MKRLPVVVALAVATTLALTACGANSKPDTSSTGDGNSMAGVTPGGQLTIISSASELNLDPAKSQNLAITTLGLIERRLTTWKIEPGSEAEVVPDLATDTGTPSDDGKTWTYTLKDGLKFSDGTPVTTADIKYSVERSFAPELSGGLSYHKSLLVGGDTYQGPYTGGELASIETPDAKTIVFHLNSSYGDWPWIASMPAFSAVPKAKDNPATYGENPVATGPYQVGTFKQGDSVTFTRNPNWSADTDTVRTAGPDTIVYQLGQDPSVAAQRLIADSGADKSAFGASFVPPAQLVQIESNESAKSRLVTSDAGALAYLSINTQSPQLTDVRVRQALNYAVDKKAFQIASGGAIGGDLATTLITPGIPGRVDYDLYPADPTGDVDKAKSLLSEAGVSALTLRLATTDDPSDLAKAQAIQQGLERVGITVTIDSRDYNAWAALVTGEDATGYDLALSSWQPDFPSANGNIQPLFDSSQIGGGGYNISRYSNPDVDALIAQATSQTDPAQAQALWAQADKKIMADAPVVPLTFTKNSFLHGSNVENFFVGAFPAYPNYLLVSLKQS